MLCFICNTVKKNFRNYSLNSRSKNLPSRLLKTQPLLFLNSLVFAALEIPALTMSE
jgi:hypothetical protein